MGWEYPKLAAATPRNYSSRRIAGNSSGCGYTEFLRLVYASRDRCEIRMAELAWYTSPQPVGAVGRPLE